MYNNIDVLLADFQAFAIYYFSETMQNSVSYLELSCTHVRHFEHNKVTFYTTFTKVLLFCHVYF